MSKQFEQLEILYKQVLNLSKEIKLLIFNEKYDDVVAQEAYKSQIVSKITLVKKTVKLSDEEKNAINELKKEILFQEKENLNHLKELREKTLTELKNISNKSKVSNKYEQIEPTEGTICDYTSD
ncbi:flagellar protein FliT [bacterium]|nr:flagellar protein FliT [bacterium]